MRVIYRYSIDMAEVAKKEGFFTLELPMGSEILHLGINERPPNEPCIWALVDPDRDPIKRKFLFIGTGQPHLALAGAKWQQYVGTFQQQGYVWHIWEVPS